MGAPHIPPRIPVSEAQIERVVARFYAKVRRDPTLGPVFAGHIEDWPSHEVKIASFWRNALLLQRSYDGNPMQAHRAAGDVRAAHFPLWLRLFDDVLVQELPKDLAQTWSVLVHRIGRGLSLGLPQDTADEGVLVAVPNLRG